MMAEEKQLVLHGRISMECESCQEISVTIADGIVQGEEKLYHCSKCRKIWCEDCSDYHHRNNRKGHSFDSESDHIQLLQQMIGKKEDAQKAGMGRKLIVAMIGEENWRRFQPAVTGSSALLSSSAAGVTLFKDLVTLSPSISPSHACCFGGGAMIIITGAEIAYAAYRWHKGEICGKEFLRLSGKTIVKNGAAFGGIAVGAKLGAYVGTAISPGVGSLIGVISGAILGFLFGWTASKIYEHYLPNGEQAARKKAIDEALLYFHFDKKDIKNEQIFNKRGLQRKFRQFALDAHPDRNDGDVAKWGILSAHYGALKALLEERQNEDNKKIVDKVLAVQQ